MQWKEEFSRDIARVLMEQYSSVADALFELVDNPIDFRRGRVLQITVEVHKEQDLIVAEDHGGEGMDAEGIAHWMRWGSGRKVKTTDISRWRVGGKAACGYLGDRLVMYAKAAGKTEVWFFEDEGWGSRSEAGDWGRPEPLPRDVPLPRSLAGRPREDGYVRIELSHLRPRIYNIEDLRWELSNVYRRLLERGEIAITINGQSVEPLELPRSSSFDDIGVDLRTRSNHRVRGWIGRLDRDAVAGPSARRRIQGGIRCLYQGRLVRPGEYFGHSGDTKGSLASLIGEVELRFVRPNLLKNDFDRSSREWAEVHAGMHALLTPVVREFRKAAEKRAATREDRKVLGRVCDEVAAALSHLQQNRIRSRSPEIPGELAEPGDLRADPPVLGYGGRKRRQTEGPTRGKTDGTGRGRAPSTNLSVAPRPEDTVGRLVRLLERVGGGSLKPPAILDAFDPSLRSGWRTEGRQTKIVINTSFPLYHEFGPSPGYLAETVIMELAKPVEGEPRSLADYLAEVNALSVAWARVHQGAE